MMVDPDKEDVWRSISYSPEGYSSKVKIDDLRKECHLRAHAQACFQGLNSFHVETGPGFVGISGTTHSFCVDSFLASIETARVTLHDDPLGMLLKERLYM